MAAEFPAADVCDVALALSRSLSELGCDYAFGGALALGYWSEPRGTLNLDITLFALPPTVARCIEILTAAGCELDDSVPHRSLADFGYCGAFYGGSPVKVFLSQIPFYQTAKQRRREVPLADGTVQVWDPETLAVFKMMFFRRKDLADVEQLLRTQGDKLDAAWVGEQIETLFGRRDPRTTTWREIVAEVRGRV